MPLEWEMVAASGDIPTARRSATLGYDAWGKQLVLYGGTGIGGIREDTYLFNTSTGVWRDVTDEVGTPPPRRFDAVFGVAQSAELGLNGFYVATGLGDGNLNDVWVFNFTSLRWSELITTGPAPPPRYGAAGGIDPTNPRYLVLSHGLGNGPRLDDAYMLDLVTATWYNTSPSTGVQRPSRRCQAGGVVGRDGALTMHGGCGSGGYGPCPGQDVWTFASAPQAGGSATSRGPGRWTSVPTCAGPRRYPALAQLPNSTRRVLSFGGAGGLYGSGEQGQVSVLDTPSAQWNLVVPRGAALPSVRSAAAPALALTPPPASGQHPGTALGVYFFGGSEGSTELWLLKGDSTDGLRQLPCESAAPLRTTHGLLMLLGWGILLPLGVTIARFGRGLGPLWFTLHWMLQVAGVVLMFAAFIVGILMNQSSPFAISLSARPHAVIGLLVVVLGLQQAVNGCARPHVTKGVPPTTYRRVWEIVHKVGGRVMLLLGIINPFWGFAHLGLGPFVVVLYSIWVGVLTLFWVFATLAGYPTKETNPSAIATFFGSLWPPGACAPLRAWACPPPQVGAVQKPQDVHPEGAEATVDGSGDSIKQRVVRKESATGQPARPGAADHTDSSVELSVVARS